MNVQTLKKVFRPLLSFKAVKDANEWLKGHRAWRAHRERVKDFFWDILPPSPERRYDHGGVLVGDKFFIIAGYTDLSHVISFIDVFDLIHRKWTDRIPIPKRMAHSHLAIASDGQRYIYIVSGQRGPQCMPAVCDSFCLDVQTKSWSTLPDLPEPRYAATMQLWRGRLHAVGGSMPDRYGAAREHWSLAVSDGAALDNTWRREPDIPRGGCHRASAVVDDELYVLGGQEGDFMAIKGDPNWTCTYRTQEFYHGEVYKIRHGEVSWTRLMDMPIPSSHTEASVFVIGRKIYVLGGQIFKDPKDFRLELTDAIQCFDAASNSWTIVGHLPYRVKTLAVSFHQGQLYIFCGQRDVGPGDPSPGEIVNFVWKTKLPA